MKMIHRSLFLIIKYSNNAVLFSMFTILLIQVIFRRVLSNPLPWPEEMAILSMIWITFLGAYQCTAENSHLKMSFLEDKIPSMWKPLLLIFSKSIVIWFLFMTNIWAYPFIQSAGKTTMPITGLPMWVPYGMIWLAFILMFVEVILQLITEINKAIQNFKERKAGHKFGKEGE
ncbi:TRAP transporter small permease [Salipaludibacillus sp. CUR1]|uniref:TRAP transporter small permease n=1 Tax=Salipaludibacillus sp. CUR1 TaxID=2820003 RepID=UPI001E40C4BE|nr:TRAP transporter small permease [Salipaludibacillus sp. CUR1]MCE7792908.1 TRAP transporter small permease [Salipaludibacillus sp. CUR1]